IVAWIIGLWDTSLLKDTVILTATVAFPLTFRSFAVKTGRQLAVSVVYDTMGFTTFVVLYLDSAPFPLLGEIAIQTTVSLLALVLVVANTNRNFGRIAWASNVLLGCLGIVLITWTIFQTVASPPVWNDFFQSFFYHLWLPLSLLPFFYAFGFVAKAEVELVRLKVCSSAIPLPVVLAIAVGTRLRISHLTALKGQHRLLSKAEGFFESLRILKTIRKDSESRQMLEKQRLRTLESNAGVSGTDIE